MRERTSEGGGGGGRLRERKNLLQVRCFFSTFNSDQIPVESTCLLVFSLFVRKSSSVLFASQTNLRSIKRTDFYFFIPRREERRQGNSNLPSVRLRPLKYLIPHFVCTQRQQIIDFDNESQQIKNRNKFRKLFLQKTILLFKPFISELCFTDCRGATCTSLSFNLTFYQHRPVLFFSIILFLISERSFTHLSTIISTFQDESIV